MLAEELADRSINQNSDSFEEPPSEGIPDEHKAKLNEKVVYQLKEFFGMSIYLWILFALLEACPFH